MPVVSARVRTADTAFAAVKDFYFSSRYGERRLDPGICDFTFGNPHEMPLPGIVAALRERALPHDKNWFAYKTSEAQPQEYLAGRLAQELSLAFEAPDIALTTGAFAAIMVALRLVLDAGDEAVFCEPAWFCYEPMLLAADAVPPSRPRSGHAPGSSSSTRRTIRPAASMGAISWPRSPHCWSAPRPGSGVRCSYFRTSPTGACVSTAAAS
jgi:aspartate aminotransferase